MIKLQKYATNNKTYQVGDQAAWGLTRPMRNDHILICSYKKMWPQEQCTYKNTASGAAALEPLRASDSTLIVLSALEMNTHR